MGADLDILVRVVYDAIKDNVKKARANVKVTAGVLENGHEEVKDKCAAGNTVTSKGNESTSKPIRWSARVAARSMPKTACKLFTCEVLNLPGDVDDFQGPSAQSYDGGLLLAANEGCSSYVPL
ncbi:hypothetical protein AMTRI_Chr11g95250 [Amborella trichopoda]